MSAPRLTPHQAEVFGRLERRAAAVRDAETDAVVAYRWVPEAQIGSHGALWHLVRKGLVEAREVRGPRGGRSFKYRPTRPSEASA